MAIHNKVLATINHIDLPGQIQAEEAKDFDMAAQKWPDLPVQVHILDFKIVHKLHKSFYNSASKFKSNAEAKNSKVISINFRPEILEQVMNDGMESVFGHPSSAKLPRRPQQLDSLTETRSWMIKYAVEAAREAMLTMFSTTVAGDENYREPTRNVELEKFYKVSFIEGRAARVKSTFRLFFERQTLERLTRAVSPGGIMDEELLLSIPTELLNIIYTNVKSRMNNERGYDLPPGIPTLAEPTSITFDRSTVRDSSWIPLVTPLGAYYLQIDLGV